MEYTDSYKAFCDRLRIDRKLLGYDQARMADETGMTRVEYANKESGRTMMTGEDLRKIYRIGLDIDKLLVNVKRKSNSHILMANIESFKDEAKRGYVKDVVTEYVLYLCEQQRNALSEEMLNNVRILKAFDKIMSNTDGSVLRCVRDVNGITDQLIISENLGISRYKYSKIENNKEYPDAMVLIRLYELYGYFPTMYLDVYDVRVEMLDNIYDDMKQKEQDLIIKFIDSLRQFV